MSQLIMMIALTPIKYAGKYVKELASFEVDEDDVPSLLADGLVAFSEMSLPPERSALSVSSSKNQRTMDLMEAIESLDKDDKSLWTRDGKPKTEAIEALEGVNYSVTATLRDDIWNDMKAAD